METNKNNEYNRTYYYYDWDNGTYLGSTEKYSEEVEHLENSIIATSKKYDLFPRQYVKINEIPKELDYLKNYFNVNINKIDLDGDNKEEYIVCYTKEDNNGKDDTLLTTITLLDDKFNKIDDLSIFESDCQMYLTLEDVKYVDIDNDGIMEILIFLPGYEWKDLNILKYSNNKLEGEKGLRSYANYKAGA